MRRRLLAVVLACLLAVSATAPALAATGDVGDTRPVSSANETAPPDPESDRLGWENGLWYNETIDVNQTDGLSRSELDLVIARTMARVEHLRRLEFEKTPPVEFLSRSAYADAVNESFANSNITTKDRLHQNTKFEALFLVGEETKFFKVQKKNQGGFAAAFYTPNGFPEAGVPAGHIAIVRGGEGEIHLTETTLAHELVHALQDQHFNLSALPNGKTEDGARAIDGVVEGDASYVESLYTDECEGDWKGTCLTAQRSGSPSFANIGLVFYGLIQYGNGLDFIEAIRERGGWEAVNDLYSDLPVSTEQIIHPAKYPDETPRKLDIEDRSNDRWRPLDLEGGIDHATFGEAGLFTMVWYPGYLERGQEVIIPYNAPFLDRAVSPYDFAHPVTAGWDGDRLLPFVTNESVETNETGYVWKIAWDSREDAEAFRDAYRTLLRYHGAEQVGEATYRIEETEFGQNFGDAFHISLDGTVLTIVNAPGVEELSGIRGTIEVETATPTPSQTPTPSPAPTTATDSPTAEPTTEESTPMAEESSPTASPMTDSATDPATDTTGTGGQPGFGLLAVLLAFLALGVLTRRRR